MTAQKGNLGWPVGEFSNYFCEMHLEGCTAEAAACFAERMLARLLTLLDVLSLVIQQGLLPRDDEAHSKSKK